MASLSPAAALSLVTALRQRFALGTGRQDKVGDEIRRVLERLDAADKAFHPAAPTGHPLLAHLFRALDLADQSAPQAAGILRPIAGLLPWRYGYDARPDAPGLESAMGWAELVGPKAPIRSDAVCFGLTLIGPHTHYLPHRHPAVELYHVLAGRAEWTADAVARFQPPGAFILHARDQVHAMRTEQEPLLAVYSWTGDVVSPSVWAEPAAAE
jgi:Cupin domain.